MAENVSLKGQIEKLLTQSIENISIVSLVDLFAGYAYELHASDVHIQPEEKLMRVRFRIDGYLHDIFKDVGIRKEIHEEIISRIKVLAGMRTDEHLTPQDGRFKVAIAGLGDLNVRVSIIPTYHGENAILRVLAPTENFQLENIGLSASDLKKIKSAIEKPYGMILANGPTGSGKTTLLYTILKELNDPQISIITIEDPIEYALEGTTQIQTNADVGLTFANGLRSILRQDPNIIMVGEIRDEETASIGVNAALTGHLVLSTLHTNDSATTFPRLLDMGVPPFLVASTVNVAVSQRLLRKLCDNCKKVRKFSKEEISSLKEILPTLNTEATFYAPSGCPECHDSGYRGRLGVREVLEVKDNIRKLIMNHADAQEIRNAAVADGMTTIIDDALSNAARGITSVEEVLRVIHE